MVHTHTHTLDWGGAGPRDTSYNSEFEKRYAWFGMYGLEVDIATCSLPPVPVLAPVPVPVPVRLAMPLVQASLWESALTGWKYDSAAPLHQSEQTYTQWAGAAVSGARLVWDLYRATWRRKCKVLPLHRHRGVWGVAGGYCEGVAGCKCLQPQQGTHARWAGQT